VPSTPENYGRLKNQEESIVKKYLIAVIASILLISAAQGVAFAALTPIKDLGLYGMQLCIQLGPGAPVSLIEEVLGKPFATEKIGGDIVGAKYNSKGNLCAVMIDAKGGQSLGVSYFLEARKFDMPPEDMMKEIRGIVESAYGEPRIGEDGTLRFRIKSLYMEGHNNVTISVVSVEGQENVMFNQRFF
jgi:hypothetical protein